MERSPIWWVEFPCELEVTHQARSSAFRVQLALGSSQNTLCIGKGAVDYIDISLSLISVGIGIVGFACILIES